ncbi:MAG TPA: sigma-70 family RNA polymerase sigma factor [Thermomicrobiales bacterium]|nr:sigma-70 family RNA polymerase sigma factor [Thermomicrobiales bacterium]
MDDAGLHSTDLDDEAILAAIQRRDHAALATLYDQYGGLALGLAYRILGERGVAEDVVQEAFLAVWRRADSFRAGRGSVRSWLMAIVHNGAIDRRRGRHRRELDDVDLDTVAYRLQTDAEDTFATVAETIDAEHVRKAIGGLPDEQRQAIELAYFSGLTHQEIAEQTGTPLGTVKSRLRLGLHKLRGELVEIIGEGGPHEPSQSPAPV